MGRKSYGWRGGPGDGPRATLGFLLKEWRAVGEKESGEDKEKGNRSEREKRKEGRRERNGKGGEERAGEERRIRGLSRVHWRRDANNLKHCQWH